MTGRETGLTDAGEAAPEGRPLKRLRKDKASGDASSIVPLEISGAACHHCHARKVKCGGELPTCAGCLKANVRCMVYDPTAPQEYSREEYQKLYNKAKSLERELAAASSPRPGNARLSQTQASHAGSVTHNGSSIKDLHNDSRVERHGQAPTENRFVGQDTAVGFLLSRLHPSRMRGAPMTQLERPELRTPRTLYHAPHPFPPRESAVIAIRDYFQHHHPAQPVLNADSIYNTLDSYTLNTAVQSSTNATQVFRLFMALAIGSIRLFRLGTFEPHPFGYFTAALEVWTPSMSSFNTIEDIEHFLLIAQFGFYYDIGCSLWELGRLSMRTAVELGLHRLSPHALGSEAHSSTDRSRRVFWMAYMLDRSSSYTLGRPFAIADESITTRLPDSPTSPEAHVWRVRLSRLTSQMRCRLRSNRGSVAKDSIPSSQQALHAESLEFSSTVTLLRKFNTELQEWRNQAPYQDEPSCLIESQQYFDLLYHEARLGLLRAASDKLTALSPSPLPKSLLRLSLSAACNIISTFNNLRHTKIFTCTRAEAHLIFVTSLVLLSSIQALESVEVDTSEDAQMNGDGDPWFDFLEDGFFHLTSARFSETISLASQLLSWLSDDLPDFAICARIFEDTRRSLGLERFVLPQSGESMNTVAVATQAQSVQLGIEVDNAASTGQPWMHMASGETARFQLGQNGVDLQSQNLHEPAVAMPGSAPSFDLATALLTESLGVPAVPSANTLHWPFSSFEGMAAIDACFSGYVWDQNVPWEGSPSMTMDSV